MNVSTVSDLSLILRTYPERIVCFDRSAHEERTIKAGDDGYDHAPIEEWLAENSDREITHFAVERESDDLVLYVILR